MDLSDLPRFGVKTFFGVLNIWVGGITVTRPGVLIEGLIQGSVMHFHTARTVSVPLTGTINISRMGVTQLNEHFLEKAVLVYGGYTPSEMSDGYVHVIEPSDANQLIEFVNRLHKRPAQKV
uniref:Transmembrane protein, putative n=1 Tax=Tanacetum cinerariifolium TaxID=118510 RepID=A0A699HP36_TANCI|nr:transmembrane protein, putative [Tanacetum cinerariifolium]